MSPEARGSPAPPADHATPPASPRLDRRLGAADAAAIVLSNVIGGGIFIVPVIVAGLVPDPIALLTVWLAGGLLAFAGAGAYAELAAARPRAGAEYVYLREAFGPLAGFLTGWTSFVAGFSGAIAAGAVGLAEYVGRFVPAAADSRPFVTVPLPLVPLEISPRAIVALTAIAALSAVHIRGLGPGRLVQNVLAGLKVGGLVVFVALALSMGDPDGAGILERGAPMEAGGWLLALVPVMFAYSGWNAAAYVSEEIRDPARTVPRALVWGTVSVIAIYLAMNIVYLYAMPIGDLAALEGGVVDASAERLFGVEVAGLMAAFSIVSLAASISAMTIAGPRVYFAMARDRLAPRAIAAVHPRFRTPALAIVAQGVWSGVLVASGTLAELVSYTGFAVVLFTGVAVAGLFVLRRRDPPARRPFTTWGYPYAPALYVAAALVIVVNEIWRNPGPSLAGLTIIGVGVPVYGWLRRSRPLE